MLQEFVQEITNTVQKCLQGVHTAFPGVISAYDPATGLASVQPSMKFRMPGGATIAYPQIAGVPVVFPQTMDQKATIAYPIKEGDGCLIIVAEQSIDYWMYGKETDTNLAFDPSNSICIVGLFAKVNPVMREACEQEAIIMDMEGARITVKKNLVQIDATEVVINGNTTVNGSFANQA